MNILISVALKPKNTTFKTVICTWGFWKLAHKKTWAYQAGGGGRPPPVCWANKASQAIFVSQSGNIGLKINGTNFVGNSVNFVGNMLSNRNFLRKNFFDNSGTIRKSRANFFPSRTPMQEDVKHDWNLRLEGKIKMCMFHSMFK
jgi:hypothetical protein